MSKLTPARALTAHVGYRMIRAATIVACALFGGIVLATALLVYFFSAWWWLLLTPFIVLFCLFFIVRLLAVFIVRRIHTERLNEEQQIALTDFSDKIETLIEARATPWPVFALLSVKDLVVHRDIVTIKKLIKDSTGLRRDYQELEKLFS